MLGVSVSGFAGEAIFFDDPGLVGYRDHGRIYGFYGAENKKFSCAFFFFQDESGLNRPDVNGYADTGLLTFVPGDNSFEFSDRDKLFDIKGDLYRSEDEWVIKTSTGQAGCENSTGGASLALGVWRLQDTMLQKRFLQSGFVLSRISHFYTTCVAGISSPGKVT